MAEKRIWTSGQQAAIDIRGKTLLVSAAAGSGKTATLTERIIRSITEGGADISKMLIVTFTRAAAAELKERIFKALSEALADAPSSRHLNEQLIKLGSASICTIDAFYLNLIRQNFSSLGISASCRIADSAELELLKMSVMDEVVDRAYDTDEGFPSLADCFIRVKSINRLSEPLLSVYDDVSAYVEGVEFLSRNAEALKKYASDGTDLFETPYGVILRRELLKKLEYYSRVLDDATTHALDNPDEFGKRAPVYAHDRDTVNSICRALSDNEAPYCRVRELFIGYSPMKMVTARGVEDDDVSLFFKNERGKIKDDIRDIAAKIFSRDEDAIREEMLGTAEQAERLYSVLSEFARRFDEEKSRRGIMDFNDVRRLTLRLLVAPDGSPTETALSYRDQFTDIYIDEYQDVDRVQDMIFSAISRNNRFMVGDIKQSIYGFRGAEPQVFADYRRRFPQFDPDADEAASDGADGSTIFMSDNFRCDKNIIDFTNLICGALFEASAESIGYTRADDLRHSKQSSAYPEYVSPRVEVSVILTGDDDGDDASSDESVKQKKRRRKKDPDAPDKEELEAEYIASEISRLIGKERLASGRLIEPGDIAILYRSNKMVAYLSEALGKRGILCSEGGGDSYFESPDVLLTLSLLNAVDNPHRDIHLAGALCSPLYGFSLDDLITIRRNADSAYSLYDALVKYGEENTDGLSERCRAFDKALTELRMSSISLPVDRFLRLLFESDTFVASGLLSDRNDYGEGGNLLRLYDYARTFESGSFRGLYNFIEFINSLIENDKMLEVAPKERSPKRVTLTTMHHSKGLEFPVCFICGTGSKKNMKQLYSSLLYEYPTGIAMKLSDSTGFARINTPLREAIAKSRYLCEIEEEMRILYVALTRARERLYITATKGATEKELMRAAEMRAIYACPYVIDECKSFIEWILLPFAHTSANTDCARLRFIRPCELTDEVGDTSDESHVAEEITPDRELYESLARDFDFKYKYSGLVRIPAKLSVSRLYPDILDENDTSAELTLVGARTKIPDFFISSNQSKASGAERGTATHLFLQFCDFNRMRSIGVSEELARLIEKKFIPENIAELIYTEELERFRGSKLAERICSAAEIIREQRFNLLLPAKAFSGDENFKGLLTDETLAVQGVIDLILVDENGDIELYDYKTDRLTAGELRDRALAEARMNADHGMQLSYYAHAVERLFEKRCKRVCVYSTHSAMLYDIERVPLKLTEIDR